MKNVGSVFIGLMVFLFSILIFPTLQNTISSASLSEPTATFIRAFPLIFILLAGCFPVYTLIQGVKH